MPSWRVWTFLILARDGVPGGKRYTMYQHQEERDKLRARFTKWMEVVAYRAKLNYLDASSRRPETVPLDLIPEEQFPEDVPSTEQVITDQFDFEEEKLAFAFSKLPSMKQEILTRLFVLEEKPENIARELGCTVQNVYNQRSLALKRLREALEGGESHE